MLTGPELNKLLKAVTSGDRRTTDEHDIAYWSAMARQGRWTYTTALRALVIFRTERPGEWIEPGHITGIIRDARRRAAETFTVPDHPNGVPAREYPQWHRRQLAAHVDRVLEAWAEGAELPVTPAAAAELSGAGRRAAIESGLDTSTCPPRLREQVARDFERIGRERPDRHRRAVALPRRVSGDPERRAAARAELDGVDPAPLSGEGGSA